MEIKEPSMDSVPLTPVLRRLVFTAAMAITFMAAIELHIVATVMPSILPKLGGINLYSWVFGGFVLTQAVTTPIYGKLADLYGRRRILALGTTIFLLASLFCGFANSMPELIVYRALQGLGAGAILPLAHTIVGDIYTPEQRAKVQGQLASVWAAAALAGPALGALIVTHISWQWVFWINIPIGIVALAMIQVFYRETGLKRVHSIDYLGGILLMLASGTFMMVVLQGSNLNPLYNVLLLALAFISIIGLVFQEKRAPEPLLPLSLLRNPLAKLGTASGLVLGAMLMAVVTFMPAHVQGVIGASASSVAIAFVAMSLTWSAAAAIGGRLMIRTSYRTTVLTGAIMLLLGSSGLYLHAPTNGLVWMSIAASLIGAGMGFTHSTYIIAVQSSVSHQQRGIATSTLYFSRMLGQAIGAATFGAIVNAGIRTGPAGSSKLVEVIMDPVARSGLQADQLSAVIDLLANALKNAYLLAFLFSLVALFISSRVPRNLRPIDRI